jgi:hypothetical protein
MSAVEDSCPFDPGNRAQRCISCCATIQPVPPCVAAYLGGHSRKVPANVIPLQIVPRAPGKKAA